MPKNRFSLLILRDERKEYFFFLFYLDCFLMLSFQFLRRFLLTTFRMQRSKDCKSGFHKIYTKIHSHKHQLLEI